MAIPRIRVFAGPNGSGKSTLFDSFSKKYPTGYFLNADFIENELTNNEQKRKLISLFTYEKSKLIYIS